MITFTPAAGSNLSGRSYCANKDLYWGNLKVQDAKLSRNSQLDTYSVSVLMADENKPVLSHIFSSSIMKTVIFISGGEAIGQAIVVSPIDGVKFQIGVPDREAGKLILDKLKM